MKRSIFTCTLLNTNHCAVKHTFPHRKKLANEKQKSLSEHKKQRQRVFEVGYFRPIYMMTNTRRKTPMRPGSYPKMGFIVPGPNFLTSQCNIEGVSYIAVHLSERLSECITIESEATTNFADFGSIFSDLGDFTGDERSFKDLRRDDSDDTTDLISKNNVSSHRQLIL